MITKILAIETSTQACSASLMLGEKIFTRFEVAPRQHGNLILGMVDSLMMEAQIEGQTLDAIALSEGPGAFTGIRVATGVVQGLAFGWQVPVVAVSTLEALIWQAHEQTGKVDWVACLDARMNEVYIQKGTVENGKLLTTPAILVSIEVAESSLAGQNGVGDIQQNYPGLVKIVGNWVEALPSAEAIAKIALQRMETALPVTTKIPVPVYLRNDIAVKIEDRV